MISVSAARSNFSTCNADRSAEHESVYYCRLNNMHALCVAFDGLFAVKLAHKDCYIRQKCKKGKTNNLGKERVFDRWSGL